jgi:hypothetical protein
MSAYEKRGQIEVKLRAVAEKYFNSWFLLDFISAFRLYYIQGGSFAAERCAWIQNIFFLLYSFW